MHIPGCHCTDQPRLHALDICHTRKTSRAENRRIPAHCRDAQHKFERGQSPIRLRRKSDGVCGLPAQNRDAVIPLYFIDDSPLGFPIPDYLIHIPIQPSSFSASISYSYRRIVQSCSRTLHPGQPSQERCSFASAASIVAISLGLVSRQTACAEIPLPSPVKPSPSSVVALTLT